MTTMKRTKFTETQTVKPIHGTTPQKTKNPAHIERGFVLKAVYNYSALSAAASPASPFFAAAFLPPRRRVAFGFAALAPFLLPV